MTIWQQRLIIFVIKALGILALVFMLGWFLFYNYFLKKDFLIKYVPENAVLYSTIKISQELKGDELYSKAMNYWKNEYGVNFDQTEIFNNLAGNNLSFAVVPVSEPQGTRLEYLLIFDLTANNEKIDLLIKDLNILKLNTKLLENKTSRKKILIVSSSPALLTASLEAATQQKGSLARNIKVVFDLRSYTPDKFLGKIYIDTPFFTELAAQSKDLKIKSAGAMIKLKKLNNLYLGFNIENNKFVLQNGINQLDWSTVDKAISNLPQNTRLDIKLVNLSTKLQELINNMKNIDPVLDQQLQANIKYLEGNYKFDLQTDILPLIEKDSELIMMDNNEFFLNLSLADNKEVFDTEGIDRIVTTYLANQNLVSSLKQMPDYTYITQVIRPVKDIKIIEEDFQGIKLKSFTYQNNEFIYVIW
ncbi:MAG: hypothetical protein NTZ49_00325, partial [Candidatus Parcubacteria bacterium]|nr:hypothetical protein [Candidatus Parcubacteria bacterium]